MKCLQWTKRGNAELLLFKNEVLVELYYNYSGIYKLIIEDYNYNLTYQKFISGFFTLENNNKYLARLKHHFNSKSGQLTYKDGSVYEYQLRYGTSIYLYFRNEEKVLFKYTLCQKTGELLLSLGTGISDIEIIKLLQIITLGYVFFKYYLWNENKILNATALFIPLMDNGIASDFN